MRQRLALVILALVATIAVHPLAVHGCSCGHDFDFHLLNWLEAAHQFRHGTLHPQWAATPAWNAGEPRFVFYPPLSWILGALLTLLTVGAAHMLHVSPATAFATTPILYTWLVLMAAGAAFLHVAQRYVGRSAALLAAALYATNAYTLFTAYERTAYAELLASALFPFLLACMLPPSASLDTPPSLHDARHQVTALALVVALLWLANAPAAVMGCYTLALLGILRCAALLRARRTRAALVFASRTIAGVLLGLALAACFLLPAIAERPWVQLNMAVLPGMRPEDNTLFHHTADAAHDAVLHTASVIAMLLLAATAVALGLVFLVRSRAHRNHPQLPNPRSHLLKSGASLTTEQSQRLTRTLALSAAVLAFMLTPLSDALWRHLPELAFLQFPWRLLAVLAPLLALSTALLLRHLPLRPAAAAGAALTLAFAASLPAYHAFRQPCDPEDTPQSRYAQFTAPADRDPGSEPTDEYTPATADNDALAETNPPFRLLSLNEPTDTPPPASAHTGPAPQTLDLHLAAPMRLVLNLRDYPAWSITRNGAVLRDHIARSDGLLTVLLPAGDSHLQLRYRTTVSERAGELTSVLAACLLIVLWRRERRTART